MTIWGEDPDWAKYNNKRPNESSYSVKNIQYSEEDESMLKLEYSICLELIKSSNLAFVNGCSHTFVMHALKLGRKIKSLVLVAELSII